MEKITRGKFWAAITAISIAGLFLRFLGFHFIGVDYQVCLSAWFDQMKEIGNISALAAYKGNYNYPYATILLLLTFIPVPSLYSIKMVSVLFDFLTAGCIALTAMHTIADGRRNGIGLVAYALVLCNPLAVMNSGYLAQCESIWTALGLLSFYLIIVKERSGAGMFVFGAALTFKLQAIFILPILLIFYFYKKKFSLLNLLWIPVALEILCIPAIIGGCSWSSGFSKFFHLMGEYPFMFYYYPNVWTFFQDAPYHVFGTVAVCFTFIVLLIFAVLFTKCGKQYVLQDYIQYAAWTAMTCAMLLPCMHERYNYMAEMLLPISAVFDKKLRIPALVLILTSMQCIGQQFLHWPKFSYYALATINIIVYLYFSAHCLCTLYKEYERKGGAAVCRS
ncbi:MAG: hypothetical protein HFH90_02130 [Lachnospiraceae bacterium]|nr:hypothetical protein [Lachnospiraceae bacterium]